MIAQLRGRLISKELDHVVVEAQGVGYRVFISVNCFYALPEPPQEVTMLIYTNVREDAIHLFGFLTPLERRLFTLLLTVSGVGPKVALATLSGYAAPELAAAIAAADSKALSKIPGIGKKTAERIIVDLSDKAAVLLKDLTAGPVRRTPISGVDQDAVSALLNLGYKESDAEKAVQTARHNLGETAGLEDIVRAALKQMLKG